MATKNLTKTLFVSKELPAELKSVRENGDEGQWFWASREVVDSVGDIVRIDGLSLDEYHRPPESHLKVLAQHIRALPNGEAPVVGIITDYIKTVSAYEGKMVKSLAVYVQWLRDPQTKELLPLAAHYKQMVGAGGIDSGSVGMLVTDSEPMQETGGLEIKQAKLYEFSLVSVPALSAATAIKELEDRFGVKFDENFKKEIEGQKTPKSAEIQPHFEPDGDEDQYGNEPNKPEEPDRSSEIVAGCVRRELQPLVDSVAELGKTLKGFGERLDVLESAIVVLTTKGQAHCQDDHNSEPDPEQTKEFERILDRLNKFLDR